MTIAEQLFKKGMEEGRRETAKKLLRIGLAEAQAAEATELSMYEVIGLRKEVQN